MFSAERRGKAARRIRSLVCGLLAAVLAAGSACAEVFIEKEKPADWEERDLLRIWALYALDCDSFVLECGGETMLLDGGNSPKESALVNFLKEHGWEHLTMIFNSHPHDDHIQAHYCALNHEKISADVYLTPFREDYSATDELGLQRATVRVLERRGIPFRQVFNGDELSLGGAEMTVYRYDGDTKKTNGGGMTMNDMSGILWVRFGDAAILLTADIGGTIQQMLAQQYGAEGLRSDILKAPHHGKNKVNEDLLKAVDPELVIITGKVDRTWECVKQLNRAEIEWKRTSYGTVLMETDGTDWYVTQDYPSKQVKNQEKQAKKKK